MVTVRFAPSPTGYLHLGSARTALFNWLYARHAKGRFLLRIEDTDKVRSDKKYLDEILEDLAWLGLDWDAPPIFQSERFGLYRQKAEDLLAKGTAYREGDALIFKIVPGRAIDVDDMIHGRISFQTDNIKDQVLIKSDGSPAYNFSCVVDDAAQEISHILRGDDHISNTPKQILFYEALGLAPPRFGHMPLIMGADGAKLSKRHGGVSVREYKSEGFLPEALANYLFLLGWTPPTETEVHLLAEAAKLFEISAMNDVQAKFDIQKLKWINGEYIMKKSAAELLPPIKDQLASEGWGAGMSDDELSKLIDMYKIRIKTFREFTELTESFFKDDFAVEEEAKKKYLDRPESRDLLRELAGRLETLDDFKQEKIEAVCRSLAQARGLKAADLIHPSRLAVTGKTRGAGLFELMELLGREKVIRRLRLAGP
jgi:glutamyl-tRNA synthetase